MTAGRRPKHQPGTRLGQASSRRLSDVPGRSTAKLDAHSRGEAVARARELGLLAPRGFARQMVDSTAGVVE
jgi:hypothetical protein